MLITNLGFSRENSFVLSKSEVFIGGGGGGGDALNRPRGVTVDSLAYVQHPYRL